MLAPNVWFRILAFELDHDLKCALKGRKVKKVCMFTGSRKGHPECTLFNTDEGGEFMLVQW